MTYRRPDDLPRLSGRPDRKDTFDPPPKQRETIPVFRRFFDLLERLEGPRPPDTPSRNDPRRR